MNVELFTLCDAATISHGKLNIIGTFDEITVETLPSQHDHCAIATKLRFERKEEGPYSFELRFCDSNKQPLFEPLKQDIFVEQYNGKLRSHLHVWNLSGLELTREGHYHFELFFDGKSKSRIPLHVQQG